MIIGIVLDTRDTIKQCNHFFKKNGTTSAGTVRYRCTKCGISRVNRRPKSKLYHQLELFTEYITHYDTKARSADRQGIFSRSTAYRRMSVFLRYTPSPIPVYSPSTHQAIMLDGFYIAYPSLKKNQAATGAKKKISLLLLAIDAYSRQPLHWAIYHRFEDDTAWSSFLTELGELGFTPRYLIHDGSYGIRRATDRKMPSVLHQRCLVHVIRNTHKDIGLFPKVLLARQLQRLIYRLVKVSTIEEKDVWCKDWEKYCKDLKHAQDTNSTTPTKAFLELHRGLKNAVARNELFTFLDHPGLPNNTNAIESLNRVLREGLRRHRGMKLARREAFVAWVLLVRSESDTKTIRAHYEKHQLDTLFDT